MSETRKLAAILVADVVGYSRLAGADEDRILARLRTLRSDLIDPTIAVHHGRIVKRTGDGSIVEFRSVVDAVNCAIEVQKGDGRAQRRGRRPTSASNFGSASISATWSRRPTATSWATASISRRGWRGSASRAAIACRSEPIGKSGATRSEEAFVDLGENATQKHRTADPGLFAEVAAAAARRPQPPHREIRSAAPFDRRSSLREFGGDPEQDYFVDGVTESLTTDLSQMSGMLVIGRNTAFSYKSKPVDLKQIGRELNVRYVLEGSVQRSANRMRVNVQLIDAESGNHLWADRFDKPVADLFDMQDEIVARLANALNAQLIIAEARRAERAPSPDLDGPLFSRNERVQQRV